MSIFWPSLGSSLTENELCVRAESLESFFREVLAEQSLPSELGDELVRLYLPLAAWLADQVTKGTPLIVGVNGAQGSGKSTLCALLARLLEKEFSLRCCVLSIDDLYLTKAQRQKLAQSVHPLLATRGVPGTHDIELGLKTFAALRTAVPESQTAIPRFDKSVDDRSPASRWDSFSGRPDLIFFEGWCVGAMAQEDCALAEAVNLLETEEDPEQGWRRYVNRSLNEDYPLLFTQLDLLLMLKIPCWEMVMLWRSKQEAQLAARQSGRGIMDQAALQRFVMHYERLTRHQLVEMPQRADLVLELNEEQRVAQIIKKAATA